MSDLIINNHLIDTPIEDILKLIKEQSNSNIFNKIIVREDYVSVTCPSHKGGVEKHPSMGVYCGKSPDKEYGSFHCFTCGFSGSLYHLVAECFNRDDEFGKKWLIDNFSTSIVERIVDLPKIELKKNKNVEVLDESFLDSLQDFHPYMVKRKLNLNVCNKFKVKYEPQTQSLVFPIWDEKGRFIMCTRRCVNNKTFIIDAKKEKPVYLYNFIKEYNINEVTIVESQINSLTLWSWGYPSCALLGTGTQHQYDILNKSGIRHYYLAFDGDSAGDKGIDRFIKNIRKDVFIDIILIPRGKDINDLSQEEFEKLPILSKEEWVKTINF